MRYSLPKIAVALTLLLSGCSSPVQEPSNEPKSNNTAAPPLPSSGTAAEPVAKPPSQEDLPPSNAEAAATNSNAEQNVAPKTAANLVAPPAQESKPKKQSPTKTKAVPTADQLAAWKIPEHRPMRLLVCNDGFGDGLVQGMSIRPDGKMLAVGGALLTLWPIDANAPSAELLADVPRDELERPIRCVAFSPDGSLLAAGDHKGTLRVWNVADNKQVLTLKAHDSRLTQLAFSPDMQTLATTSYSGEVRLWNMPDGKKKGSFKASDQEVTQLLFISDKMVATTGSEANIWDIESLKKETVLSKGYVRGSALAVSSDRKRLAFGDSEPIVQIWDTDKQTMVSSLLTGANLICFSRDDKKIATYASDATIHIFDAETRQTVQVIDADGGRIAAMAWLPDADILVVASERGRLRYWGTEQAAETIGLKPIELPVVDMKKSDEHTPYSSAQMMSVFDVRSFPRLPDAEAPWSQVNMMSYKSSSNKADAELFYQHVFESRGWTDASSSDPMQPGLTFTKDGCVVSVNLSQIDSPLPGKGKELYVSLAVKGDYDARWLPKFSPVDAPGSYSSASTLAYRTKADLTDIEAGVLKTFHDAGWTAYTRLNASSNEAPKSRTITMIQGGSELIVSIGHPADSQEEFFVQLSVSVTNKSLPIPRDSGWIEFDHSTDLMLVANTKMDMNQSVEFYDKQMAAQGWLAREAGRQIKDGKAWLPYIRGQQDVLIRIVETPDVGIRVLVGDVERASWQLKKLDESDSSTSKEGIEAADFTIPKKATKVKYDVDEKKIEFELAGIKPPALAEQFAKHLSSLGWKREDAGVADDEYVLATFTKSKAEIQIRARLVEGKDASAMVSGDGLLWSKPLPTAPVRISYGTWLQRNHRAFSLEHLDDFVKEMHLIPATIDAK